MVIKKCCICNKNIWFWNKFYRKYGYGILLDTKEPLNNIKYKQKLYFCSKECYNKTIDKDSYKGVNRFFKKNEYLINPKEAKRLNKLIGK